MLPNPTRLPESDPYVAPACFGSHDKKKNKKKTKKNTLSSFAVVIDDLRVKTADTQILTVYQKSAFRVSWFRSFGLVLLAIIKLSVKSQWYLDVTGSYDCVLFHSYHIYHMYSDKQTWANSIDPNETPQNAASQQGLHCLPLIQQFLDRTSDSKLYLFKF